MKAVLGKTAMKSLLLVLFFFSVGLSPAVAQDKIQLPCEVLEVSPVFQTDLSRLNTVHYMLIHHANAADRMTLSKWLKNNSGKQVTFVVNGNKKRGVFCRMPHCFGRGLLVYIGPVKVKPRQIITLFLPVSSSR